MTATITPSNAAAQTRWADKVFAQHFDDNMLAFLTTPGEGGTLKGALVKEDFPNKEGETVVYHFRNALPISSVKTGDTRVQGTGTDIQRGTDSFTLTRHRAETGIRNTTQSEQRTKHKLLDEAGEELSSLAGRYVAAKVLDQLVDVSAGKTQNRYLYGSSESNYNATHATALANVDEDDDKLTLQLLTGTKTKLITQSAGRGFMRPAQVMTKSGVTVNKFVGLFHPRAIRDLKKDGDFRTSVFNKENPDFDVISGANFVGEYEGILMYQLGPVDTDTDKLLASGVGASNIDVAHNLILGAGAAAIGYGTVKPPAGSTKYRMESKQRMMITTVDDDHGGDALMAFTMNMAFKKLVDNSSGTAEDVGVFHLFTSAKSGI